MSSIPPVNPSFLWEASTGSISHVTATGYTFAISIYNPASNGRVISVVEASFNDSAASIPYTINEFTGADPAYANALTPYNAGGLSNVVSVTHTGMATSYTPIGTVIEGGQVPSKQTTLLTAEDVPLPLAPGTSLIFVFAYSSALATGNSTFNVKYM